MLALNIYTKLGKSICQSETKIKSNEYEKYGLQIIKAIEAECEKDKAMSNLKGKIKEIKAIIEHM
jgi:hypothetical protein